MIASNIDSINTRLSVLVPDLGGGGAERVAVHLANGLFNRGHQVDMVLMSATGDLRGDLLPGIRVVDLQAKRACGVLLPLVCYLRRESPHSLLSCMCGR